MATFLLLPDEIKIKIFEYLSGVEKIELLKVCREFHRVGVDRDVLKSLNFANNYKLTLSQLRFIARKPTVSQVTKLNLNGVHWIPSGQLRDTLSKFQNLTALYVLDTQLFFRDLVRTLENTKKVRKLAFSMKPDNCSDVFKVQIPIPISHLYVTYNSHSVRALTNLLEQFVELEELWMVEPKRPVNYLIRDDYPWINYVENKLVTVTKKIVFSRQHKAFPGLLYFFNALKDKSNTWNFLMKNTNENSVFCVLEKGALNAQISNVDFSNLFTETRGIPSRNLNDVLRNKNWSDSNVRCLHFLSTNSNQSDPLLCSPDARIIRKMKCESGLFYNNRLGEVQRIGHTLFKRRRIGIGSQRVEENGKFEKFTNHATEIDDFEIVDNDMQAVQDKLWHIDNLSFIKNWKILKKLTITSVNIHNGKFLIDITKNCPMLSCLKIQDALFQDNLSASLFQALKYAANLKDLRYERKGGIPVDQLFESLTNCSKLERVYVQCRNSSIISKKPLETMITRCENLVFLFIYVLELPDLICRSIKQGIHEFGVKPQQIISIRGQSYDLRNIMYEDIPSCHVEDMVCQDGDFNCDFMRSFFNR